jgi:hypothetical protein
MYLSRPSTRARACPRPLRKSRLSIACRGVDVHGSSRADLAEAEFATMEDAAARAAVLPRRGPPTRFTGVALRARAQVRRAREYG